MSLPCISTALNAVGLGILIDLLQKKTLTLTLTNNVNPFNNVKPFNDHSTVSLLFHSNPNLTLTVAVAECDHLHSEFMVVVVRSSASSPPSEPAPPLLRSVLLSHPLFSTSFIHCSIPSTSSSFQSLRIC